MTSEVLEADEKDMKNQDVYLLKDENKLVIQDFEQEVLNKAKAKELKRKRQEAFGYGSGEDMDDDSDSDDDGINNRAGATRGLSKRVKGGNSEPGANMS